MTIELKTYTVSELHAQLQALIDQGQGDVPVCATDCRGRYPFEAYTVLNRSGYTDALLIYVRPDAHFAPPDPLPLNWGAERVADWNAEADSVKQRCGAFADRHHKDVPSSYSMRAALERIWNTSSPDASAHLPELRGITEAAFGDRLVAIAGEALGRSGQSSNPDALPVS